MYLDYKQVSAAAYMTMSPFQVSFVSSSVYKWLSSFGPGQPSLEFGMFYAGQKTPDPGWELVQPGLLTVFSNGQQVTTPIFTTQAMPNTPAPTQPATTATSTSSGSTDPSPGGTSATTPLSTSALETLNPPDPQAQPSSGVGPGAVAGVAIGCLVGGILIGGLIAWLVLRKRGRSPAPAADAPFRHEHSGMSVTPAYAPAPYELRDKERSTRLSQQPALG